jgi:hypothetical protein
MCASFPERLKTFAIALFDASVFKTSSFLFGNARGDFLELLEPAEQCLPLHDHLARDRLHAECVVYGLARRCVSRNWVIVIRQIR